MIVSEACAIIIMTPAAANDSQLREMIQHERNYERRIIVRVAWEKGQAASFCRSLIVAEQPNLIISAGGDGTLHEIVNALFELRSNAAFDAQLLAQLSVAVLPYGTGNDFARSLQLPLNNISECWNLIWQRPKVLQSDLIEVKAEEWLGRSANEPLRKLTVNVASLGQPALFTAKTKRESKDWLGGLAYFLEGLSRARTMTPFEVEVTASNFEYEGPVLAVIVANGRFAGGGWRVAPNANLRNQELSVLIIPNQPLDTLVAWVTEALGQQPETPPPGLIRFSNQQLKIHSTMKLPINLDGELHYARSLRLSVAEHQLPVLVHSSFSQN